MLMLDLARKVLLMEAESLVEISSFLDDTFESVIKLVLDLRGRLVLSGVGKSALIAQKIAATMNSTGTPALFMHAADALHGDLGLLQGADALMLLSKSGETPELKALLPIARERSVPLIAMVGNVQSSVARAADFILNTTIKQEACPYNLAPTSSTTAQLALGDALALCLMQARRFSPMDFAGHHPGGILGRSLRLRLQDMLQPQASPQVYADDSFETIILSITEGRLGASVVVDAANKIIGIITDGDIRRALQKKPQPFRLRARDIMSVKPWIMQEDTLATEAIKIIQQQHINHIVLQGKEGHYVGIVHLQDFVAAGFN